MDSCATVLGTAELCAYIVDFVHDSAHDLKSFALVSRVFTSSAQRHLFYEIDLVAYYPRSSAIRLRQCLDGSPHLRLLVRRLTLLFDVDFLTHLRGIPLPHLNFLSLSIRFTNFASSATIMAARDLIALPSLHTVVTDAWFEDVSLVNLLFARCTPALRSVDLRGVKILSSGSPVANTPLASRTHIKELRLFRAEGIAAWFMDPECPLDLGQLQGLDIYVSASIEPVLQVAISTLEELRVHTHDLTHGLSLRSFSALRKLRIDGDPPDLVLALSSTLPLHLPYLAHITIASRLFKPYTNTREKPASFVREQFGRIDTMLADMHLPALNRVTLSVLRLIKLNVISVDESDAETVGSVPVVPLTTAELVEQTRGELVRGFPRMSERGVLVVHDYRVPL
ncbi:hypothetical protein B0H16DRAFT_1586031 [Mycena metata]|uniref:Uncharacterized protein n=1 Tax=Mycena metata TaxID=1033252 RepID=A0AAD7HWS0_9AGAR|nr:hypothetical protein B0H16DRAFT_1586031 [Mycena metata]